MIGLSKGLGGYPWHGLWRKSTGKITSPTGQVVDAPFDQYLINSGACWMVKIDGLPEPVTSAGEQEKGMTWLNYALLCGDDRALYGRALGANGSIYLDSHGMPWLMRCNVAGSRTIGLIEATVSLKRFGIVGPEAQQNNYAKVFAAFTVSDAYPYPNSGGGWGVHLDMSYDGRQHLIGVRRIGTPVPNDWLGYACIALLTVSGSPDDGDVDISINVLADESDENWDSTPVYSGAGTAYPYCNLETGDTGVAHGVDYTDIPAGMYGMTIAGLPGGLEKTVSRHMIGGARFSAAGVAEIVMFRASYHRKLIIESEIFGFKSYTQVGSDTESVTMKLDINGVDVGQAGLSRVTEFSQTISQGNPATMSAVETTAEAGTTHARSYGGEAYISGSSRNGFFGFSVAFSNELEKYGMAMRLSNSVYSLRSWGYSTSTFEISNTRFIFGPAVGVTGVDSATIVLPASATDDHPNFASEHPVTGQVVRSNTPVCFV